MSSDGVGFAGFMGGLHASNLATGVSPIFLFYGSSMCLECDDKLIPSTDVKSVSNVRCWAGD